MERINQCTYTSQVAISTMIVEIQEWNRRRAPQIQHPAIPLARIETLFTTRQTHTPSVRLSPMPAAFAEARE
jgi:hypothetical protein